MIIVSIPGQVFNDEMISWGIRKKNYELGYLLSVGIHFIIHHIYSFSQLLLTCT